jgi:hypothetical protein
MELKRIVIGASILAAAALGGLWLFQQIPVTRAALQQACLEAHDRSLAAAYIQLPEGVTAEEWREMTLARCYCVAREAQRKLPQQDLVAFARNQMSQELYSQITAINRQCGTDAP